MYRGNKRNEGNNLVKIQSKTNAYMQTFFGHIDMGKAVLIIIEPCIKEFRNIKFWHLKYINIDINNP